ncbi:Major facilitator superfamily domain general substrate transporter [Zalerion maritima]|uniref:Major facilitator superfamily domain general substrate transporter n=1 Tax=Zalerion maritima TaxID=339359 RepID=A0AAD5RJG2_9PEZI|nr:Major facilitator superfamily domain general substrate transporter [Zalerion maritima]
MTDRRHPDSWTTEITEALDTASIGAQSVSTPTAHVISRWPSSSKESLVDEEQGRTNLKLSQNEDDSDDGGINGCEEVEHIVQPETSQQDGRIERTLETPRTNTEKEIPSRPDSAWSRATAASADSSSLVSKSSWRTKLNNAIDTPRPSPVATDEDWEYKMQSQAYRQHIFFTHCKQNESIPLRYLLMSFPTDHFETAINTTASTYLPGSASRSKKGRSETGLHIAASHGSADAARYLVTKGALIDSTDKDGRTPLMHATRGGHYEVAKLLLDKGARTWRRDKKGLTALHFALPNVSGAKSDRKSLEDPKLAGKSFGVDRDGGDGDGGEGDERANIAIALLMFNLERHAGEDHLGQNYSPSVVSLDKGGGDEKGFEDASASLPANGGKLAWMQVLGTFLIFFNTAGISSSYGMYQTFYPGGFSLATTQASSIGSVQSFLLLFTSVIGGPLYDSGLYKPLLLVGSSLVVLGTFTQSLSTQFYQLLLSQGIAVGFGGGLFGFLGPSILSTYFTSKLPLASGVGALGGGVAGIVYPILFRNLQPLIGFGWTVRVFAIIAASTLVVVILVMKPRTRPPGKKRTFWDPSAFRDLPYLTFVAGNFMVNLGLYVPFSFVSSFAAERGLATDEGLALYLLAILNVGSLFGRVIPSLGATRLGPLNTIVAMGACTGVVATSFLFVSDLAGLLCVAVAYGFSTGAYFALQPATLISLCPDPAKIGTRVGMASAFLAFGALPTSTVAAALLDALGFDAVWLWAGATTGSGALLMAFARVQKAGLDINVRI